MAEKQMVKARAYLVETIPQGLEELAGPHTRHTADVLHTLVRRARQTIDLTAVYWNLLHHPESADEEGFTQDEIEALGVAAGRELYEAIHAAAARGVQIRILQSPGFLPVAESAALVDAYPARIQVRQVEIDAWYGGGIMHQKMWLVDGQHLYLGSANMDWRALSQVKELGLLVEGDPQLAADLTAQFDLWWHFAGLDPEPVLGYDARAQVVRPFPCWSPLLPPGERCTSPFDNRTFMAGYNLEHPLPVRWNGTEGTVFTTGSPPALCGPGRTHDIDALRHTIARATERVSISVMHFAPMTRFTPPPATRGKVNAGQEDSRAIWWPVLYDSVLQAVCRGVDVRLLVGRWPHGPATMIPHLQALADTADACTEDRHASCGRLEVRLFTIPGWDSTTGAGRRYPDHSRVNHPKYVVTEKRLNVGTSNMSWGDFARNGGIGVNTDHPDLVSCAQAIFDRDWASPYACALT